MEITNKPLKRRIIEISYKHKLSHLGSCLTAVDIIDEIYQTKKRNEKFVLSSGHAGLALYVVLEKYGYTPDAEKLFQLMGVHPDRLVDSAPFDWDNPIDCSTGSLGQGLPIAVGMALSDRTKNVYCLISDGECAEGSIQEAFQIITDQWINNIFIHLNHNGWGAYKPTNSIISITPKALSDEGVCTVHDTSVDQLPFLKGQDAHYYVMTEDDYNIAMEILK